MVVATLTLVVAPPAQAAPPPNDDFANAQVLTDVGTVTGTNLDATTETGEPVRHVDDIGVDYAPTASVWYRWTSPDTASQPMMQVSTVGSSFDTVLAVYDGGPALGALTEVAGNDEFGAASGPSRVQWTPARNTTYWFAVDSCCDGFDTGGGSIRLRLSQTTGDGSISGFVKDAGGQGIENICVVALDDTGEQVSSQVYPTDSTGEYLLASVEAGTDRHLKFTNCGSSTFAGQFNGGAQTLAAATDIVVAPGDTVTDDEVLVPGGTITGSVSADDAGYAGSLASICVTATMVGDPDDGFSRQALTNAAGAYTIDGLDGGAYRVRFAADCGPNQDLGAEDYPTLVTVTEGSTTSGVDAGLGAAPGTITGNVHSWETGPGIANICVRANNSTYTSSTVNTDANGDYTISNVPAGTGYVVRFSDCHASSNPYTTQWWNRALTQGAATTIAVTSGHTTGGIDASMFRAATLAGHVTDSAGDPRDGVCVGIYQSGGSLVYSTTTAVDGGWSVVTPPGNYNVFFSACGGTPTFQELWWHSRTTQGSSEDVFVDQGDQVTNIDQLLPGDGMISGRVLNTDNQPVRNICVTAYADGSPVPVAEDDTDAYGYYDLGVDAGTYDVQYLDCTYRYQEQWFDDEADQASADPIDVPASTTVRANATLARWGTISGTIRDEAGDPVPGICVATYAADGTLLDNQIEDAANGTYTVGGMATGDYRILFTDCAGSTYNDVYYDNELTLDDATAVHVNLGSDTGGKDVVLHSVAPANVVAPSIGGVAQRGVTLVADHGQWDHSPAHYDYQWFRCDTSGVVCDPVDGDTDNADHYTLTSGDVGHRIRVDVRASNAAGDATMPSDLTDVVVDGPPANDNIQNRVVLSGSLPIHVTGDNVNATRQPGEPAHDGYTTGASVWYEWTAPSGAGALGRAVIDTGASSYQATVSVYSGSPTPFSGLQLVVEDDYTDGFTGTVDFAPVPGTTYYIAVDGYFDGINRTTDTGNIDLTLSSGTGLSGTVTDTNGDPIRGICVTAYNDDGGNQRTTAADGTFYMSVPPGYYTVEYEDCPNEYATQWYDGADVVEGATPVQVVAGAVTPDVDAVMDRINDYGSISGTVTNEDGDPLPNICVTIWNVNGSYGGNAWTAADGTYEVRGLGDSGGPVDYTVDFLDCSGFYGPESWKNQIDSADADPVTVGWDQNVAGIDAVLQSQPPVNITPPVARGRAAVGVPLRATNGTWAHEPSVFTFQWYRCEADGTGCLAVDHADQREYTPTVDDIGFRFLVNVAAQNSMDTTNAQSALTSVVTAASAPPNDDIADRQVLTGSLPIVTTGDNVNATRQPGEPDHLGYTEGASVWYEWTAGSDNLVTIDLAGSSYDTTLSVYDGTPSPFSGLHLVAENDEAASGSSQSQVTFAPVDGTTYYIAVDGYVDTSTHEISEGDIDLRVERATGIAGTVTDASGDPIPDICITATENPEPSPLGPSTQTGLDGTYYLDVTPGTYYVDFYDCTGQYEEQWYDGQTDPADATAVPVSAGTVVGGVDATMVELVPFGSIGGTVTNEAGDPIPDICVVAIDSTNSSFGIGNTDENGRYLLRGLGDPDHPTDPLDYTVLFSDCSGTYGDEFYDNKLDPSSADVVPVQLDQDVTGIDAVLQSDPPVNTVAPTITGQASVGETLTAHDGDWDHEPSVFLYDWYRCDADGTNCSSVNSGVDPTYVLTSGDEGYTFKVIVTATNSIGSADAESDLTDVVDTAPPANDDIADRQPLAGSLPIDATGTNVNATREPGEPDHLGFTEGASVWYEWTAPSGAAALPAVTISLAGSSYDTTLSVYDGTPSPFSGLHLVAENDDSGGSQSQVDFAPDPGTTYYIAVDGYYNGTTVDEGTVQIEVSAAGGIAGTVRDAGGDPIQGICVDAFDSGGSVVASDDTNANGKFVISGLEAGDYKIDYLDCDLVYVEEWYDDQPDFASANSVHVDDGVVTTGIDAAMARYGTISGRWTDENGDPVYDPSCGAYAYDATTGDFAGSGFTDVNGYYTIGGLQTGTYVVDFSPCTVPFGEEWFDNKLSQATATPVSVTYGQDTGGIDVVLQDTAPVNTTLPSISGSAAVGSTLTAAHGQWDHEPSYYEYQWERCDSGGGSCLPIDDATGTTYDVTTDDLGHRIRVTVRAVNSVGDAYAESDPTTVVGPPANVTVPTVSGVLAEGETLTTTDGTWSGAPTTFTYEWLRCNTSGASCTAIGGATASTYVLTSSDSGHRLRSRVTASNSSGSAIAKSAQTGTVGLPIATTAPKITGGSSIGSALTVSQGTWSGNPTSYAYQWLRCDTAAQNCTSIPGATSSGYTTTGADGGFRLRAQVTATNGLGSTTARSGATTVIGLPTVTASPSVTGTPTVGSTLTTTNGTWTGSPTGYAYQWMRCDTAAQNCTSIPAATANAYTLTGGDEGYRIRAQVTATNGIGSASGLSNATTIVNAPIATVRPRIAGPATVGGVLTVTDGTWLGALAGQSYQWVRCESGGGHCGPIAGETGPTYTITSDDVGHRIRVWATTSNTAGATVAASNASAIVGAPILSVQPLLSGLGLLGTDLTATAGDWDGSPSSYAYAWQRCDSAGQNCTTIPGATGPTYTISTDDVAHRLRVVVTATNGVGATTARSRAGALVLL